MTDNTNSEAIAADDPITEEVDTTEDEDNTTQDSPDNDGDEDAADADSDTEDSSDSDGDDDATEQNSKRKGKNSAKKRINELTREKYEAIRREQELRREIEELRQKSSHQQIESQSGEKPTLEDYNYDQAAYIEALAEWKANQVIQSREAQLKEKTEQEAVQDNVAKFQQKCREYEAEVEDFVDVAINNPLAYKYSNAIVEAIRDSEIGPQMAYHLGSNLDETAKLLGMTPVKQAIELGKLEARLQSKPAIPPKPANVTKTPPPPPKVAGNSKATPDPSKMSWAEFCKWREASEKKNGRR